MTRSRPPASRWLVEERRRRIVELLQTRQRLTVDELTREFQVSGVTVRHDLDALARAGKIVRTHGGALRTLEPFPDAPLDVKETLHRAEKVRIGRAAAALIPDGATIIIDSGTTTMEIARHIRILSLHALTVITNALTVALELSHLPTVRVVMIGGDIRQMSASAVGPIAERTLRTLNADTLFLGADALDLELGITTPDTHEAHVNQLMMKAARDVTVVADSSKFGRRCMSTIAMLADVDRIVTDTGVDADTLASLHAMDIEVHVV